MVKILKETSESFYLEFPPEKFYIIRWLKDGGYHYYPTKNGELPEGFGSLQEAKKHMHQWGETDMKIVNGTEASKYQIPKRW